MVERLGEMRKGRRERIEKGSRENRETRKRQNDNKKRRAIRRCDVAIVSSSPQGTTSWGAQASKFGFYKVIELII